MSKETDAIWEYLKTLDLSEGEEPIVSMSYNDLTNKPSIEGVTLTGNKTYADLNLQAITNNEIEDLLV